MGPANKTGTRQRDPEPANGTTGTGQRDNGNGTTGQRDGQYRAHPPRFKHVFFHVLMRKEILLKHLLPRQDELSGKKTEPVLNEIVKHVLVDVLRTTQVRQTLLHLISAAGMQ